MHLLGTGLVVVIALSACEQQRSRLEEAQPPAAPAPAQATAPAPDTAPAPAPADDLSGTVQETTNAAGYTYARVDHGGVSVWIAGPETTLGVGTKLGAMHGSLMENFHSDTLNRTFDQIYFVNELAIAPGGASPNPHGTPAVTATKVEKLAPAPGGSTIADVFAHKAALAGKPVVVRGQVVKVNNDILGRNWLHLQDGTGGTGTNDLLVTTQAKAALGDIVIAHGKVSLDRDFGAGYKYAVLVEDATIDH
jgi:hypothetical protein